MSDYIDARDPSLPEEISGRVCIIGAGAAGITLARSLARQVSGVILVESGGHEIEGETQALYRGRQLGLPYFDLISCRLRYFGGTTNHWSGFCRANDPVDYEPRPELGLPGWPFDQDTLAPYVQQAGQSLGIDPQAFDPAAVLSAARLDPAQLVERHGTHLQTKIFQLAPDIRLGPIYREEIRAASRITPYLHLNATHLQLDPSGRHVTGIEAATLTGRRYRIRAEHYVLCCHAIENARLLLASDDVARGGIGNAHDHVGRHFMDHATILASRFIPTDRFPAIYDQEFARRRRLNANLGFTDDHTRENRLLQYYCRFLPIYQSDAALEARAALRGEAWAPGGIETLRDIAAVAAELDGALRWRSTRHGDFRPPPIYQLDHRIEQAPNRDSRVVLSERRDALGSRIADLDWRLLDADIDTFREGQAAIGREMAALGYGRIEAEEITRELVEQRVEGHYHHVGTTRMSDDPAAGVVDRWGRVHGIDNLHVGGSSVFPSAGYSGPTMMIIAMALRQAEQLHRVLA